MNTANILPEVPRETPLCELTGNQIDALETWYNELHKVQIGGTLRSILGEGREWQMRLDEWLEREAQLSGLKTR